MNYFLHLNKTIIIFLIIFLISLLFLSISFKKEKYKTNNTKEVNILNSSSSYDILEPKFTINNNNNKIYVTAKQGNFVKKNNILLKEEVKFKSNNFIIYSDNVLFNQDKQTAMSDSNSIFKSDGTTIKSEGFNIIQKGDVIKFNGKSKLILTK